MLSYERGNPHSARGYKNAGGVVQMEGWERVMSGRAIVTETAGANLI